MRTLTKADAGKLLAKSAEVGKLLGISAQRVGQLIRSERLPAEPVGRGWLIDPRDLKAVKARKPGRPKKGAG